VPHAEQEMLTLSEHLVLPLVFIEVQVSNGMFAINAVSLLKLIPIFSLYSLFVLP